MKIVIAGLYPAIHLTARADGAMDALVKPAHDKIPYGNGGSNAGG